MIKVTLPDGSIREYAPPVSIEQVASSRQDAFVTVVLPEFVPSRWWQHLFHNQSALLIKGALLFKPNVVLTNVPFHLSR